MPADYAPRTRDGTLIQIHTDNAEESLLRKRQREYSKRTKGTKRWHPYEVKPVKTKKDPNEERPVLGKEIVPELYPGSIALLAKTRSGKTTVIAHLTEHCIDERTAVFIFCSTVDLDPTWIKIVKDLRHRGVHVTTFTSIHNPQTGRNQLLDLFNRFEEQSKQDERNKKAHKSLTEIVQQSKFLAVPNPIADPDLVAASEAKKEEEYTTSAPKRWVFLDDLAQQELRLKTLDNCLKKTRHYKSRMTVSTQHIIHLQPSAMTQLTMVCMWKGYSPSYMFKLHDRLGMQSALDFKQFWLLYSEVTKQPHAFLTYYIKDEKFRAGFALPELDPAQVFGEADPTNVHLT